MTDSSILPLSLVVCAIGVLPLLVILAHTIRPRRAPRHRA